MVNMPQTPFMQTYSDCLRWAAVVQRRPPFILYSTPAWYLRFLCPLLCHAGFGGRKRRAGVNGVQATDCARVDAGRWQHHHHHLHHLTSSPLHCDCTRDASCSVYVLPGMRICSLSSKPHVCNCNRRIGFTFDISRFLQLWHAVKPCSTPSGRGQQ